MNVYKTAASLPDEEVVEFIEEHFNATFKFRPGWSTFGEIICEYLVDDFFCNQDYISTRYEMSNADTEAVLTELKLFLDERDES